MRSDQAAVANIAATTQDGRLVYLSAVAKPAQPGLEGALTSLLYRLAERSYSELLGDRARFDAVRLLKEWGFQVENLEIAVSYRCPHCAASIQLNPEVVVYVCPYCGWAGDPFGRPVSILAWPPAPQSAVERLARRLGGTLVTAQLLYVPLWVAEARAEADYTALVTYTEAQRTPGGQLRYVTRRKRVSGTVTVQSTEAVVARLNAELFGAGRLEEWAARAWRARPPRQLAAEEAKPIAPSILAPELSESSAAELIKERLETMAADRARSDARMHSPRGVAIEVSLERFVPRVEVLRQALVFTPYWLFTYRTPSGLFAGVAIGPDAAAFQAEAPMSNVERAAWLAGAWAASLTSGALAQVLAKGGDSPAAALALALFGVSVSLFLAGNAFKPAKVV